MEIRKIQQDEKYKLEELIKIIEKDITSDKWWLPIKKVAKMNFFNDEWTCFLGLFDSEKLIGASALFFNEYEFGESLAKVPGISGKTAEIGRCMINPLYRGKNLLVEINNELIIMAKQLKIKNLLATIHPENLPSKNSFKKLGFTYRGTIIKQGGYDRDIYMLTDIGSD